MNGAHCEWANGGFTRRQRQSDYAQIPYGRQTRAGVFSFAYCFVCCFSMCIVVVHLRFRLYLILLLEMGRLKLNHSSVAAAAVAARTTPTFQNVMLRVAICSYHSIPVFLSSPCFSPPPSVPSHLSHEFPSEQLLNVSIENCAVNWKFPRTVINGLFFSLSIFQSQKLSVIVEHSQFDNVVLL